MKAKSNKTGINTRTVFSFNAQTSSDVVKSHPTLTATTNTTYIFNCLK
ncbi:hypothetical protein [Pedobacter helvus]|uniref:Uncharacterized protein n=1 Tax=Pedobacter helvus TaxID=2563444 RepID=A0ABW9JEJ2_9SPHI|nr:hypothetical protein [Pedobacter ureilyticus]